MPGACHTQAFPAAILNRHFGLSPVHALIDLIVRCRLCRQMPVRLDFDTLAHLRVTLIPQRRPACRGYAGSVLNGWGQRQAALAHQLTQAVRVIGDDAVHADIEQ